MRNIYITAILLIGITISSYAQSSYWSLNWDITKAAGDTGDYIGNINFRGVSFDGRAFINDNLSIGGSVAWYTLYDKLSGLPPIEIDNGDGTAGHISGTQARYLNLVPVLINSHFYFDSAGDFKPYIGIGLGGIYTENRTEIGLSAFSSDSYAFGAQPEIGVYIPFGYSGTGLNLALRYLYGTSAGDLDSLSMFTFAIGIGFMN